MLGTHYFHETLDSTDRRFVTPGPTPNGSGSNQIGGVDLSSLDYTHKTDSYALFGNLAYDLSDNFTVTGGLRWTTEKKSIDLTWPSSPAPAPTARWCRWALRAPTATATRASAGTPGPTM